MYSTLLSKWIYTVFWTFILRYEFVHYQIQITIYLYIIITDSRSRSNLFFVRSFTFMVLIELDATWLAVVLIKIIKLITNLNFFKIISEDNLKLISWIKQKRSIKLKIINLSALITAQRNIDKDVFPWLIYTITSTTTIIIIKTPSQ